MPQTKDWPPATYLLSLLQVFLVVLLFKATLLLLTASITATLYASLWTLVSSAMVFALSLTPRLPQSSPLTPLSSRQIGLMTGVVFLSVHVVVSTLTSDASSASVGHLSHWLLVGSVLGYALFGISVGRRCYLKRQQKRSGV